MEDLAELLFLKLLIKVLQHLKEVSLEKIANALLIPILFEIRRKKVQQFLSRPSLTIENLWFPLIKNWLDQNFDQEQTLYLVLARTKWERTNLLMISLLYDQRALPIYFEALPKLGNSEFTTQARLFSQVLPLFKTYKIAVLGDREFCSVKLANCLREEKVQLCLRLKKNEFIQTEDGILQDLDSLKLKPVISLFLPNCQVTKTQEISGFNVACKWKRVLKRVSPNAWFILTNLPTSPPL